MTQFIEDVGNVANALRELFPLTPLQRNDFLSRKYDAEIFLKREDLTPVRSYKIRGAFHFVSNIVSEHHASHENRFDQSLSRVNFPILVGASAGNHAQGLAFACRHFQCHSVIFMPVTTPQQKIDKTQIFGGDYVEIRLIGDTFDQTYAAAQDFALEKGGVMAPPFDHSHIIRGQATVAYEIANQLPAEITEPDLIVVPVGGGGLAAGICRFVEENNWKTIINFAEPLGADSLYQSIKANKRVKLAQIDTFVDGASVAEIGEKTFSILKNYSLEALYPIPENRLCHTILEMLNIEGIVLEPAGALAIDALKDMDRDAIKNKKIILIVSGGNFDFERLPEVKERALRYAGLKKYYIFRFPQRPGALRNFLDLLDPEDDIARFEYLKKSARNFGSVLIAIETKKSENFIPLHQRFLEQGWAYQDITHDPILSDFII